MRAELSLAGESFVNEFALEGAPGSFFTRDSWQLTSPLIGLVAIELPSETDMLPDGIAVDLGGCRALGVRDRGATCSCPGLPSALSPVA